MLNFNISKVAYSARDNEILKFFKIKFCAIKLYQQKFETMGCLKLLRSCASCPCNTTLSLGHKLLYPATGTFLRKETLNLCCGHYVMSATLRYLFSVPLHSSLYFHVLLMLLSYSDVYFILISKYFLGRLSLLRNYKLKSVADITLRTLHIGFIDFIQLRILFQLFSKFS